MLLRDNIGIKKYLIVLLFKKYLVSLLNGLKLVNHFKLQNYKMIKTAAGRDGRGSPVYKTMVYKLLVKLPVVPGK